MAVPNSTYRVDYNGDGFTTEFAVPFYFLANADVTVTHVSSAGTETVWTEGSEYTLAGAGDEDGGLLTASVAPSSGTRLVIRREVTQTQEIKYPANDPFPSSSHEQALDKLTMIAQEQQEQIDRSLKRPVGDSTSVDMTLPRLADRASKVLGFDSAGRPVALSQLDKSADTVTALGSNTPRTLAEHLATLPDFIATGTTTAVPLADLFGNPLRPEQFFSGTTAADRRAALQAAIDQLDAIGGGRLILSSSVTLAPSDGRFLDLRNTSGIEIVGLPGAQLTLDGDGVVFDCEGATRLRFQGFKVQGSHDDEPWTGTSVWKLKTCSMVRIENVETADLFGDCIRFDDGVTDVWINGSKLDGAGRNGVTMNVDTHDTSRIWCRDSQITNFGNSGWQAEDEDVDVFMTDIHLERLRIIGPEGGTGGGVSFSKSVSSGASAQRKYKRIFMTDLVIENVFRAITLRGAEHVRGRGIVAVNGVERGVEIGNGNTCSDIDIEGTFDTTGGPPAVVQNGHVDEPCRDIVLRGRYKGSGDTNATINAEKVDLDGAEFVGGPGCTVACRIGTTVKELNVMNCEFTDATTRGLQIDGNADIIGEIVGNRFRGGGVTMGAGIYYNGSSTRLLASSNTFAADVTNPIDDASLALRIGANNAGYEAGRIVALTDASTELTVGAAENVLFLLSSDDADPANRLITLTNGAFGGQRVTLIIYTGGANKARVEHGGNVRMPGAADLDLALNDAVTFIWNKPDGVWRRSL